MQILVTGAHGFVGSALVRRLTTESGHAVIGAVRSLEHGAAPVGAKHDVALRWVELGDLAGAALAPDVFADIDVIVHCAARVHVMHEVNVDPLAAFRAVNVNGTLKLAQAAALAGVKRFVFLSSVKVHGESTTGTRPLTAEAPLCPADAYARSKLEAEKALLKLAAETGLEVVIVRSPLVYGPGVKANFRSMMVWLDRGVPLPLGAIRNRRSLVALDNLVDLLTVCLDHPRAAGQAFLVSDGEDLSTTELLRRLGVALGKPARLVPVPAVLLSSAGALLGKRAVTERLCGSLQLDIVKTRSLLGWSPPVSVDRALAMTAADFLKRL